jgi:hypothetical protein
MEPLTNGLTVGAFVLTLASFPLSVYALIQEDLRILHYVLHMVEIIFPYVPGELLVLGISAHITCINCVIWINVIMAGGMMMGYVNSQTLWMKMLRLRW